jgi:murein DD-endopeptidase MepM/ murein hydrolase activator NlpD
VFPACAHARVFKAEIVPDEVTQGGVFIIRVTDLKTEKLLTASLAEKSFQFTGCGEGCFLAIGAVDINTKPGIYDVGLKVEEKKIALKLTVKDTIFPTQKLTLPGEKVFLSEDNLKRVERENLTLKSIFQQVSERLWEGDFVMPLENEISTVFGVKRIINREKISVHKGLDIRGKEGEKIRASNSGKVVFAGELFFGGNTLILDHGQGIYTLYMHLSDFKVNNEEVVSKGEVIGSVGSTGRATGPHLHFGVKVMDISVSPLSLIELKLLTESI